MSLHFLIDGYNAIKKLAPLKDMSVLKDARISLVKNIQKKRVVKGKNNQVTVVFDGKNEFNQYLNQTKGQIKIIFSRGESADETIKRMVSGSVNNKGMVVVTDDRAVKFFTASLGVKTMSINEFFDEEKSKLSRKNTRQKELELAKMELTYQQQEVINQELRRIWK